MSELPATIADGDKKILEQVVCAGDLSKLTTEQKLQWYVLRCEAAGLDPRTQPFQYVTLQGKLTLYATKTATDQVAKANGISSEIVRDEMLPGDIYRVHARVTGRDGRRTDNIGAVNIAGMKGDQLANAMMKGVTKAFRRAVLSHCGLGMLDESEVQDVPGAVYPPVNPAQARIENTRANLAGTEAERSAALQVVNTQTGEVIEEGPDRAALTRECATLWRQAGKPDDGDAFLAECEAVTREKPRKKGDFKTLSWLQFRDHLRERVKAKEEAEAFTLETEAEEAA